MFRERLAPLARRCRALARHTLTLHEGMFVVGTVYCTPHESLSHTQQTTPAMAAGITDHCWTIYERWSCAAALGTPEAARSSRARNTDQARCVTRGSEQTQPSPVGRGSYRPDAVGSNLWKHLFGPSWIL